MRTTIENYPKEYLKIIYTAGRNTWGIIDAGDNATPAQMQKFARMLVRKNHLSVLEHVNISIYIKDCSRSLMAQLTRHRLIAFSIKSQHYVLHKNFRYKELEDYGDIPPLMRTKYLKLMTQINNLYEEFLEAGIPRFVAREILPNATLTNIYATANIREWRHVIEMRIDSENTPEISSFAKTLLRELYLIMPEIFEDLRNKYFDEYGLFKLEE